jgi:two-component system chemotaxis response regulator CheY
MAKSVIVVDDTYFYRESLKDILKNAGYEVIAEGVDGAEGVELVRTHKPDLVLLDVVMPKLSGLEAAKKIKELGLKTKIVICSSLSHEPMVDEAISAGASAYLTKPLEEEIIIKELAKVMGETKEE